MGTKSVPNDVRHRLVLDRRAAAEFLIKFAIETERQLLYVRPDAVSLCHTAVLSGRAFLVNAVRT
jgi:hypothetical protein